MFENFAVFCKIYHFLTKVVKICKFLCIIELIGGCMKVGVIGAMDTEIRLLVKNLENVVDTYIADWFNKGCTCLFINIAK